MPRRVQPINRPEIRLDATLPVPLYKQLYERLRGAILTGQLERGMRLPSTRTLASELGVARMTIALAYEQLVLEGYLESRVGQGTVVARSLPATLFNTQKGSKREDRIDSGRASSIHIASCLRQLKDIPWPSYIGTFSKVLFPALRLGYLVTPTELIEPLLTMRRFLDVHLPMLEQMALFDFLHEGHYARHLRHMRHHYKQHRDLLQSELQTHLGDLLEVHAPEVGMHLVGWLPPGKDDRHAASLAAQIGIRVLPISIYSLEPLSRGGLVFGYARTDEEAIPHEVKMLAAALEQL